MKQMACHLEKSTTQQSHPDHGAQKKRIRRIRGQIDGIERMIDDRRYCVDILTQVKAVASALKSLEAQIFETHLRSCVRNALLTKNPADIEKKIAEIMELI